MFKEFREFAMKGNVVDMAVGVIIGTAFGKVVTSLVNDVLMPPLGLVISNMDFSELALNLNLLNAERPVTLRYGVFFNTVLDFIIVAFCIFMIVKGMNRLKRKDPTPPPAPSEKKCPQCCLVIPIEAKRCGHCTSTL